jgi:CDP-diacylglycerol--glycerol-3-phosphate 3-phosphatidyltransferase
MIYYARDTVAHSTVLVALTGLALVGSVLVSYSRARAESLDIACRVGFLERPERMVLLIIGSLTEVNHQHLLLHKMPQVLWVLAVLSHWTVVHRIYHTWRELREPDRLRVEEAQHQREDSPANENLVRVDYSVQS